MLRCDDGLNDVCNIVHVRERFYAEEDVIEGSFGAGLSVLCCGNNSVRLESFISESSRSGKNVRTRRTGVDTSGSTHFIDMPY